MPTSSSLIVWVIFIQIFVLGSERCMSFETQCIMAFKVVDFGTNQKCMCNLLLVINSNLGPTLPHFRDTAGFLLRSTVAPRSEDPKLIICAINFKLVQPICSRYHNVTDGQTTYDSNTALALCITW